MADQIFFAGTIEEAIASTVASRKPLVCFVSDATDDSNTWENEHLADESVSTTLKDSAVTVRILANSQEANYLNAFCAITSYPTLLIIKNGGAGIDGLTVITNPISKEDFVSKIQSTISQAAPPSLLSGVNRGPTFPDTPTASTSEATPASTSTEPETTRITPPAQSPTDTIPENTQFRDDSATARRLASIQQQHRERVARLKAHREAQAQEDAKNRELARRSDTKAMTEAAETQKTVANKKYAEDQKKRKMEAEKERRRVLEQIKADREEMKAREANRKAIALEVEGLAKTEGVVVDEKGKGKVPVEGGECRIAFKLLDGSRISNSFPVDATVEKDLRPWLDMNRVDGNHPYKLVQAAGLPSKTIEGSASLSDLGLYPSAILILKPVSSSKVSTAFASTTRTGGKQNFIVAFFASIWIMIMTFLGVYNPTANAVVGDEKATTDVNASGSGSGTSMPLAARDAARQRIRTLHDGEGSDKRSAYYNGNQLDFEPKKKDEDGDK